MKIQPDESRRSLLLSVRSRRPEITQAVLARVDAIGGPARNTDPEYLEGLRSAIETAIDHTIEVLEDGPDRPSAVPGPILTQARLAARHRVPLETMLRRYLAGHAVVGDFVIEEAERRQISPGVLRWVLRSQAARTDQVVAAISATYLEEESAVRPLSTSERRAEYVRRLLDGELLDPAELDYDFDRWHLALQVRGPGKEKAIEAAAGALDVRRLVVQLDDENLSIWLGSRERFEPQLLTAVLGSLPEEVHVGIGEPGHGRPGWRITHDQARAALSVAVRTPDKNARYADVALLASAMHDPLLATSLRQIYIAPLDADKDGRGVLLETLRAYFESELSVTSTAAVLEVSRTTVANRLRVIEKRVGYLRSLRAADLLVALRLDELTPSV